MNMAGSDLKLYLAQRWRISFPFILAILTLLFLGWTGSQALIYPYDGIPSVHPTGLLNRIDPNGPAQGKLFEGDIIVSIEGLPLRESNYNLLKKNPGDQVEVVVRRDGQQIPVILTLSSPPFQNLLTRLTPLFIALVFWLVAIGVQTFAPLDNAAEVFFVWCQVSALILIAGAASYQGPSWISGLFNFLVWFVGPLTVDFHLNFPQKSNLRAQRLVLFLLYGIAIAGGIPYLMLGTQEVNDLLLGPQIIAFGRLFLALNLVMAGFLLFYSYRHATSPGVRSKIRIVALGGGLSILLFATLSVLPDALIQQPIVPNPFPFLLLGTLPLTYGYAIYRHRLIEIERHVNRGATYILVYSILGAIYLVLYYLLHQGLSVTLEQEPLLNTILVLVLASIFVPLRQRVQKLVDTAFYGGWYDYRSAVTQITQGLEQITELDVLASTISERLAKTLRLEDTCVFLRDIDGNFSVIELSPSETVSERRRLRFSTLPRSSLSYLLNMGMVEKNSLREQLSQVELSPEEYQLLSSEQVNLWVPIIGHGQVQGLIALGPKYGGDIFSGEDLDILRVVSRQISTMLENIHLLIRLRQHAADLEVRVKERTAELHNAKERVEAILASVGDGVVVTDLQGEIQTVNAAFEKQSGYDESDLIGKNLFAVLSRYNAENVLVEINNALEKGGSWSGELFNQHKDGESFDIQLTLAPVRDQAGEIVGYVGSQIDITRQKELERLKDRFVSDVSHELRTPTTNISLFLELLEVAPPEKRKEFLSILKDQSSLLKKLVDDILDLSRVAMGKIRKIEFSPIDFNDLTRQVVAAHYPMAEAAGLQLSFHPGEGLLPVWGEHNQLARVITNLVANAIHYTFEGEVQVRTCRNDGRIGLLVSDTGMGIEPEDMPHLFERFYRGKQVSQSKIHGTGLGLAIVKEIIDLHEGKIEIQTEVGKGSTFRIWLPVLEEEVCPEKPSLS